MKGKAKVLSLLLAAAMTAGLFAGCNNSGNTPSDTGSTGGDTGSTASTPSDSGSSSGEITEINWNIWASGEPTMASQIIPELNKKSEEDIGIRVNFLWTTDSNSLLTAMQAGDKNLDVAFCCDWWATYSQSAQMGYMTDLTDLLPEVTPTLYNKLPEKLWTGMKINGRIYGVPTWKDAAAEIFWIGRKDALEGAGAVEDFYAANTEDWSLLTPVLEKVKAWHDADPTNNAYTEGCTAPFTMSKIGINPPTPNWDMGVGNVAIGVKIEDGNTTAVWAWDDPLVVKNLHTVKDWADRGLSNGKEAPQIEQEPQTVTVGCGQGWEGAQFTAWGGPTKGYDTLIVSRSGPFLTSAYVQGGANVIGANSSKVEPSLKFLEYVNTNEEYRNMMAYGVEGVSYTVAGTTSDGKPIVDRTLGGNGWSPANFTVGTMDLLWPDVNLPEDQYDVNARICDMVNNADASELLGFVLNTDNVATQISACASIFTEYNGVLRCGAVNDVDATLAECKSRLMEVGMQDIIDEYQRQIDEFLGK